MADIPGISRLILVADEKYPRYSEGDVIELTDGRLLLAVGRKTGASDFAAGEIIGMFSSDGGATWDDEPHLIKKPFDGLVDLMSVSFCRSPRGLHLFFLGRGKDAKGDTQPYQMLSADEGKTWGEPQRVSLRGGYYVVNNARVIRTSKGRMLVPAAYVKRIDKDYDGQSILVLYSDDDGVTWRESNVIEFDKALMEPGVAECADGSIYMTIRTATGVLYEARSHDGGATWGERAPTTLPAPAAPSTVVRAPDSDELWMFWCSNAKANWKQRSPQVCATSKDHGRTWSRPRVIEHDPKHSYGYISFTRVKDHALLTYYDWADNGQRDFQRTSLRQRTIPLAWLRGEVVPPVFRKGGEAKPTGATTLGLTPYDDEGNTPDEHIVGMRMFRRRGFYLGLLHVFHAQRQTVRPEWAWSHTGDNWVRTRTPCISFGDPGAFDARMVIFGDTVQTGDELVALYSGTRAGDSPSINGRATLPLAELDAWLDSLPQP
jgi:sialidase-1